MADLSSSSESTTAEYVPDINRRERVGLDEATFCAGKSLAQIESIIERHREDPRPLLLTRLAPERYTQLPDGAKGGLDYDPSSQTAFLGRVEEPKAHGQIAVVTAGTSDVPVAREAVRTLAFNGYAATEVNDVGVAGLWRLLDRLPELREHKILIVAAGMDAALPTVLGGQVSSVVIGVPTSVGYGVAKGGRSALESMLSSCSPGVSVMNIDNGYGAACAALRILNRFGP